MDPRARPAHPDLCACADTSPLFSLSLHLSLSHRYRADGDTALILAAWYGHADITQQLLEARADVDATNCDGNCALNCAAYHGFMEVASLLVDSGATIDLSDPDAQWPADACG